MKIGTRVKVKDQEITGTVVGYDWNNEIIVMDDNYKDWAEDDNDCTLTFKKSDLKKIGGNDE